MRYSGGQSPNLALRENEVSARRKRELAPKTKKKHRRELNPNPIGLFLLISRLPLDLAVGPRSPTAINLPSHDAHRPGCSLRACRR
ncbi:hypothetical protein BDW67DRAFT_129840 [Aspergillus spinulosporus]